MTPMSGERAIRILYVGDFVWWGTCLQRCRALEDLGCHVEALDIYQAVDMARQLALLPRIMRKIGLPLDLAGVNQSLIEAAKRKTFDILWLDKALLIKPATLRTVRALQPACKIVGYSPDDMTGNTKNQSRYFLEHLPLYDVYFTTKSYGVTELKQLGCPKAIFVGNAFDVHTHRPIEVTAEEKARLGGPVGFIGAWEHARSDSILRLAQSGLQVRVWGSGWQRAQGSHTNLLLENRDLLGVEYAKGICAFDINLCFLRKQNRDLQTTRSIEIPACGAFMLAERTAEHLALFEEGKEAEFFSSDNELLEKARYYLEHPMERKWIADAGRQRCLAGGYSNHARLKGMLQEITRDCQ
jgi:spore maturation protein CgeB